MLPGSSIKCATRSLSWTRGSYSNRKSRQSVPGRSGCMLRGQGGRAWHLVKKECEKCRSSGCWHFARQGWGHQYHSRGRRITSFTSSAMNSTRRLSEAQTPLKKLAYATTTTCSTHASAYGRCIVANYTDVKKDMCKDEFAKFVQCLHSTVSLQSARVRRS